MAQKSDSTPDEGSALLQATAEVCCAPVCVLLLPGACALAHPLCSVPSSDAAWVPLDLPSLVAKHLPGRRERVFWKLVLVLPDGEEQGPGSPGRSGKGSLFGL